MAIGKADFLMRKYGVEAEIRRLEAIIDAELTEGSETPMSIGMPGITRESSQKEEIKEILRLIYEGRGWRVDFEGGNGNIHILLK